MKWGFMIKNQGALFKFQQKATKNILLLPAICTILAHNNYFTGGNYERLVT